MNTTTEMSLSERLADLFTRAKAAALAADPGPGLENDGGSCNFDTPAFRVEGLRGASIKAASELSGVGVTPFLWRGGQRWWWLNVPLHGQANRRSTMMEAAQRVLNEAAESNAIPKFRACGYQQCD